MNGDCTILVDDRPVEATAGIPLGSVLYALGPGFRLSPKGHPRGLYCGMGVCFECTVTVDGRVVRSCLTPVRAGMVVTTGGRP